MQKRKYANQKPLRAAAEQALLKRGYNVEVVRGYGGARLVATKNGESVNVAVRTSSDRWIGWMRDENSVWRGMREADLILAAALNNQNAEVFALNPTDVEKSFNENLESRQANNPDLQASAPIFVCLDPVPTGRG